MGQPLHRGKGRKRGKEKRWERQGKGKGRKEEGKRKGRDREGERREGKEREWKG